jgi:hypothetical protein
MTSKRKAAFVPGDQITWSQPPFVKRYGEWRPGPGPVRTLSGRLVKLITIHGEAGALILLADKTTVKVLLSTLSNAQAKARRAEWQDEAFRSHLVAENEEEEDPSEAVLRLKNDIDAQRFLAKMRKVRCPIEVMRAKHYAKADEPDYLDEPKFEPKEVADIDYEALAWTTYLAAKASANTKRV